MPTRIIGFLCVAMLAPAMVVTQVFAQESADDVAQGDVVSTTVAQVNIYNARYSEVSADNRAYALEFDIANDGDIQPQIKYVVELRRKVGDNAYVLADQRSYDDVVSLAKGQRVHKKISYRVPNALAGDFQIFIAVADEKGMPYGETHCSDITIATKADGIAIDPTSCFLAIDGDANRYPLMNGTDVSADENIFLQCNTVTNTAPHDLVFQPTIVTRERTMFGKVVRNEKSTMETIAAGATKSLKFPVTKHDKAQAYQATVVLANAAGDALSNGISVRYVLRGESATAQNISLDKDYYKKGEVARVRAFVAGNADNFPDARRAEDEMDPQQQLIASVMIRDRNGAACADPVEQPVNMENAESLFDVNITKDCTNPAVTLTVKNASGVALDENTVTVNSQSQPSAADTIKNAFSTKAIYYWVLAITAVVVILIIIHGMVTKKTSSRISAFFFLMVAGGLVGFGPHASADTQVVRYFQGDSWANITMTYNTSKDEYCKGERVVASAGLSAQSCANILTMHKVWINGALVSQGKKDFGSSHHTVTHTLANTSLDLGALEIGRHTIPFRFLTQRNRKGKIITFADRTYHKTVIVKECPICGNGVVETGEVCDNGANNGKPCAPGYESTCTYCSESCQPINVQGPYCGDGIKNGDEQCDGTSGVPVNYTCDPDCTYGDKKDGACVSSGLLTLTWNQPWITSFCANGVAPVPATIKNPAYGETVSWDCPGLNGGAATTNQICKATRLAPRPGVCSSAANSQTFTTKPTTNLCCDPTVSDRCVSNDNYIGTITENKNAKGEITGWSWTCKGEDGTETNSPQCNAICKPHTTVTFSPNPFVIPNNDTTPIKIQAQMTSTGDCPDSECILVGKDFPQVDGLKITNGGTQTVTFTAEQWRKAKENNTGISLVCDGDVEIDDVFKPKTGGGSTPNTGVKGYCTNRSCTSDGRCQSTQKMGATSAQDCTQTCSSDADCTRGRMIETRP